MCWHKSDIICYLIIYPYLSGEKFALNDLSPYRPSNYVKDHQIMF